MNSGSEEGRRREDIRGPFESRMERRSRCNVGGEVGGEDAGGHLPRVGQQVVQRRSQWVERQHVSRQEEVRPANRRTEEGKPKQSGG